MEEKQKWCHGGILHPTLNPHEMKCNYCGWSKTEINFADYVERGMSALSRLVTMGCSGACYEMVEMMDSPIGNTAEIKKQDSDTSSHSPIRF
jgi:hypothetical protein